MSVLQSKLWLPGTSEAQSSRRLPEVSQKAGEERDPAALPLRSQSQGGLGQGQRGGNDSHDKETSISKGYFTGGFFWGTTRDHFMNATSGISPLALGKKRRSAEPAPSPTPCLLDPLEGPESFAGLFATEFPQTYLQVSKGLGGSGVVPVVVLETPAAGEEQVPSVEPKCAHPAHWSHFQTHCTETLASLCQQLYTFLHHVYK